MFPQEAKELYRSIHAPESLRQKIDAHTASLKTTRRTWTYYAAAAACFVLLCTAAISLFPSPATLFGIDGEIIGSTPVCVSMPVRAARNDVMLISEVPKELEFTLDDADADVTVSLGDVQIEENGTIHWSLPADTENAVLTVNKTSYLLYCDDTGAWYMQKQ